MSTTQSKPPKGLEQVRALLDEGHPGSALEILNSLKDHAPWAENARVAWA